MSLQRVPDALKMISFYRETLRGKRINGFLDGKIKVQHKHYHKEAGLVSAKDPRILTNPQYYICLLRG